MKISKTIMIVAVLGIFTAPIAVADPNFGITVYNIDTDVADFRGINLDVGYEFTDLIGVRASYMIGSEDEVVEGVNIEIEDMYSFDAILSLPLSDNFIPYFTIGKLYVDLKADYMGYSESASDDFTTYGAGIKYNIREAVSFSGELKNIDGDLMTMLTLTSHF